MLYRSKDAPNALGTAQVGEGRMVPADGKKEVLKFDP